MTKLNKKLSMSICVIVIMVSIVSLTINKMFIHKYYLYEKKKIINNIGEEIKNMDTKKLISDIKVIEDKYNMTIVYVPIDINIEHNEEEITENFISKFFIKDISLKKFWISNDILESLSQGSINKIYNQGKSKYSLLVKFIEKDNYVFAVATPIEHSEDTIAIINKFYIIMSLFSIIAITLLTFILSNKIIKPIEKLKILSKDISRLNFRCEEIKTNDEIEELANSINKMSLSLEKAHNELNKRNQNLKTFISDSSHEMKTPISLIKVYSMGIQDGMDDGTYIDTIIHQSENLTNIVNTLLYWAKYEKKEMKLSKVDLKVKLLQCIKNYDMLIKENNIDVTLKIDDNAIMVNADESNIEIVLNNLISNAIKYNNDNKIDVCLLKDSQEVFLSVSNGSKDINKEDIDNIWKPFYVLEKSRNKDLSGTGLGLSIVKEILEAHNVLYGVKVYDKKIEFFIVFDSL